MNPFFTSLHSMFHVGRSMFNVLLLFVLSIIATLTTYAQPPAPGENPSNLITLSTGKFLRWYGYTARTYFVQVSDTNNPLGKWNWAPIIEVGNNADISYEVDGTAPKNFFRLKPTDLPIPSGKTLDTADFDGDGISNIDEIDPPSPLLADDATDPLDGDTDHDGMNDGFERSHGLDPNDDGTTDPDNGPAGDPDGDGLSNATELALGTDPSKRDSDGDGISDWDEVMVNFTNPLTATDADSDGLADDWEKWWATQIIASGVALSPSQQTALLNGDVEPSEEPFDDGTANFEQFEVSKKIAAVGDSISPYRIHGKERAVWGTLWAHEDGNWCGISGLANGDVRWRGYSWESTCPPAGWVAPSAIEIDQELIIRAPWASVEWQDFPFMFTEAHLQQDTYEDGYTYTEFEDFQHVFKLIYPKISSEARTANFLKVSTTWGYPIAGVDPPQTVEVVQLTVPPNRTTSQEVEIKPALALGAEKDVSHLEVEFLNAQKAPTTELKVAKMVEPGVLPGNFTLNPELDSDRFYVRIRGAAGYGNSKVKLGTVENPDAVDYDDAATEITLTPVGDDLISNSLLLVSNDIDDDYKVDTIVDNHPGDRTYRIQVGGKVQISAIKLGTTPEQAMDMKIPVVVKKTVKVKMVNCTFGLFIIDPCWPTGMVTLVKKSLKERYAQVGVKLEITVTAGPHIGSSGYVDGYPTLSPIVGSKIVIPNETRTIFSAAPASSADQVVLYLVSKLTLGPKGAATPEKYVDAADIAAGYANKALVSILGANVLTPSHELLHILLDAKHDDYPSEFATTKMLWHETINNDTIDDTLRITKDQETKIHSSPFSK